MATRERGRSRTQRDNEDDQLADNHAEFMAAITNLANSMQTSAATTTQAVERLGQPTGNGNGEGTENNLGGAPMTLVTFLKVNPPTFRGTTNPTEADNWFQAVERALQNQKYFLELVRDAREFELMQLKQGSMSVAEYISKFEDSQGYVKELLSLMRVGSA
ncbi:hypothetical protein AHAS_Ahas16G0225000 [Arachis hypogaea]